SINKWGEPLCGDHVDLAKAEDGSTILVLADGLGSGVKANILSTLTAKILSTMLAAGLPIEECVHTVVSTLPVCAERGVAYSTFTVIRLTAYGDTELIQYDNPHVVLLSGGNSVDYAIEQKSVGDKQLFCAKFRLKPDDVLLSFSDGALHASKTIELNLEWDRDAITDYMEALYHSSYSAKELATLLVEQCSDLYGGQPADDTTACAVKLRKRQLVNLLFGPPSNPADDTRVLSLFFSKGGKHIVCGGTTAGITAKHLGKQVQVDTVSDTSDLPPALLIDGVDVVTEGALTMARMVEYAQDYAKDNRLYHCWNNGSDGAAQIARLLLCEASDVDLFVGRADNAAYRSEESSLCFADKMRLAASLAEALKTGGKRVKIGYF
ncbi:MAG: SpoIIE family protein phosphatase, partial [Clostridia bacterium]